MMRGVLVLAAAALWFNASSQPASSAPQKRWYKGNLHTHTTHSDGDSSPEVVARWYKEHGYQFLVLSDHNYFTEPDRLNTLFAASERFLLIGGEEVTSRYEKKAVHVNAYWIDGLVPPEFGGSVVETIQKNVDAIRKTDGIASLNHPNFVWSITPDDLKAVDNLAMFEVYNGHPTVHNRGGGGKPGLEEMWDIALTAGRKLFAVAVDDAHSFKEFGPHLSNPGRGWVMFKASELSAEALRAAAEAGDFYASTGVELAEVSRDGHTLDIRIKQDRNFAYTTTYYGAGGKVLAESFELESSYDLTPGDKYVRATITDSAGRQAWTQPVFAD